MADDKFFGGVKKLILLLGQWHPEGAAEQQKAFASGCAGENQRQHIEVESQHFHE
jgi:hypothetical protein